ncbi:hypothetical protein ACOME3_002784 [Neoechinorhynchus agilis]
MFREYLDQGCWSRFMFYALYILQLQFQIPSLDAMTNQTQSSAMRRLYREAQELSEPNDDFYARPLEDNLFEWHFTIRGEDETDFHGGIYHGRIILPSEYPLKPPQFVMTTPNGAFAVDEKICLSISAHHPEMWLPSWSIRTALIALRSFMPRCPPQTLGSIMCSKEEKKIFVERSLDFICPDCGKRNGDILKPVKPLQDSPQPPVNVSDQQPCESRSIAVNQQTNISLPEEPNPVKGLVRFTLICLFIYWLVKWLYLYTHPRSALADFHTQFRDL